MAKMDGPALPETRASHLIWAHLVQPQFRPRRHRVVAWVTIILAVLVAGFALTPVTPPPGAPGSDKLHHFVAFAALVSPCAVMFPRALIVVVPGAILLGGLIEVVQPAVGRQKEMMDFLADTCGVGIGLVLGFGLRAVAKASFR